MIAVIHASVSTTGDDRRPGELHARGANFAYRPNGRNGRGDNHSQHHDVGYLHLLDIVGRARNQGRRGEFIHFRRGERIHLFIYCGANIRRKPRRNVRGYQSHCALRRRAAERHRQHQAAAAPDIPRRSGSDLHKLPCLRAFHSRSRKGFGRHVPPAAQRADQCGQRPRFVQLFGVVEIIEQGNRLNDVFRIIDEQHRAIDLQHRQPDEYDQQYPVYRPQLFV